MFPCPRLCLWHTNLTIVEFNHFTLPVSNTLFPGRDLLFIVSGKISFLKGIFLFLSFLSVCLSMCLTVFFPILLFMTFFYRFFFLRSLFSFRFLFVLFVCLFLEQVKHWEYKRMIKAERLKWFTISFVYLAKMKV